MKERLLKIWKDPVLSKVIAGGITGALILLYNFIISKINNESFIKTFEIFWDSKAELWKFLFGLCFVVILYIIFVKKKYNKKKYQINTFDGVFVEDIFRKNEEDYYDEECKKIDSILFNEIRNDLLPTEKEISWLRDQNFSFAFNREVAFKFFDFEVKVSENPNYEFLNKELEEIKKQLVKNIQKFNRDLSTLTFPDGGFMQSVPREWRNSNPRKLENSINILNNNKIKVIEKYDELIRKGRRILKV